MLRGVFVAALVLASSIAGAHAGGRVALVVGVSKYENAAHLPNTLNDAKDMSAALKRLGFEVETLLDPSRAALEVSIRRYGDRSVGAEVSLFHFSGHALESTEHNWLMPVTANLANERDLRFEAVDLNSIREQADGAAKISIIFLDACRDNPFARRLSGGRRDVSPRGLGRVDVAAGGVLVAFATSPGQVAFDSTSAKRNSPFTGALLKYIETPGLEIKSLLAHVTKEVLEETKGKQRPWQNSSLEGDFYFIPPPLVAAAPPAQSMVTLEGVFWDSIKTSRDQSDFRAYLAQFPKGVFVELAQNRLAALQLEASSGTKSTTVSPNSAPSLQALNAPAASQSAVAGTPTRPSQPTAPAVSSRPALSASQIGELSNLLERARGLIATGDITSARLVLRRADQYGDPRAALELGGTYDPLTLKGVNIKNIEFYIDTVQARNWYGRAADLGSTEATQRLKELALLYR